jgi:23S rRNA (cytosine1962-C5)-methyltransferase
LTTAPIGGDERSIVAENAGIAGQVYLKAGREGPVRGGNPWIFSQAIARVEPSNLPAGAAVQIRDSGDHLLGFGHFNPGTTIAVRMLAWDGAATRIERLLDKRIQNARALRQRVIAGDTDCHRLVNGDGDGLSGLVIDRYADVLVVQILSAGMEAVRAEIVATLERTIAPRAIIERSQGAVRKIEGLADRAGLLAGTMHGPTIVTENGLKFEVDFEHGQKTGHFLDQRENHARLAAIARDARVLDLCCYSGGFALMALKAGAREVIGVDTSARALDWARRNLALNELPAGRARFVHAQAGEYLASCGEKFDVIVLDPPPLARARESAAHAGRLYADLNAAAIRVLAPGGHLMTFSCSVHFRGEDFIRAVRIAESRANRRLRMIARLGAGADHPVLLGHVEGEYLTGLWLSDLE